MHVLQKDVREDVSGEPIGVSAHNQSQNNIRLYSSDGSYHPQCQSMPLVADSFGRIGYPLDLAFQNDGIRLGHELP